MQDQLLRKIALLSNPTSAEPLTDFFARMYQVYNNAPLKSVLDYNLAHHLHKHKVDFQDYQPKISRPSEMGKKIDDYLEDKPKPNAQIQTEDLPEWPIIEAVQEQTEEKTEPQKEPLKAVLEKHENDYKEDFEVTHLQKVLKLNPSRYKHILQTIIQLGK
ncbi:Hypothetical_protein [Hexamita inflata]|uniref:Hypothetical_protein n=1 Tax=Hexamita inflata TaxID=28002 RepID=A0AA86TN74_9EUKA|nr:Hypothetical protein HINF_LOCUS10065 [Hexamita inflata]